MSDMNYTEEMIQELRFCLKAPANFIRQHCKVQHPIKGITSLEFRSYQRDLLANLKGCTRNIVLSCRQSGTSTIVSANLFWDAIFHTDQAILIVTNSDAGAKDLISKILFMYDNLPVWLRPNLTRRSKHELVFDNGSRIMAKKLSACAGKGLCLSTLYIDNLAYVNDSTAQEFWAAMEPSIVTGTKCIITSSAGYNETFWKLWQDALIGANGFYATEIKWWHVHYTDSNFEKKMIQMIGEKSWKEEYENTRP